jgi:ferredoxin
MAEKIFRIEWRHADEPGAGMARCSDSGRLVQDVLGDIALLLGARGVPATVEERLCPAGTIDRPVVVLFDGILLEEVVPVRVKKSPCAACGACAGDEPVCPTGEQERIYRDLPESVLRLAALKAAGLK